MAQTNNFSWPPNLRNCSNLAVPITSAQTLVMDGQSVAGGYHFSIITTNASTSANAITSVDAYGSADGTNYYSIANNIYGGNVAVGGTSYYTFVQVTKFVKVYATSAGTSTIDMWILATD